MIRASRQHTESNLIIHEIRDDLLRLRFLKMDLNIRKLCPERPDHLRQHVARPLRRDANVDAPFLPMADICELPPEIILQQHNLPRCLHIALTGIGQRDRIRLPVKQLHPEILLHLRDDVTQGRL